MTKAKKKHAPKPKAAKSVAITMVVDESGSMESLKAATMSGFNEYVDTVRRDLKDTRTWFSAICFNTAGVRTLQAGAPIREAVRLSSENYRPDHLTPLLDAIGQAVKATDEVIEKEHCEKAIVVIQTDGCENASVKYNLSDIKPLIEHRQAKGWQFVFIGAGIDAFSDAHKMGIDVLNTMSYSADAVSTRAVFGATASNTAFYSSGVAECMNYSGAQSAASGESKSILRKKLAAGLRTPTAGGGS